MIYIQNHILRVKILNISGLGKVAIKSSDLRVMLLAPLTRNLSFLLHSNARRATAQSRTVVINVMSVCGRIADRIILNVIQDSEANHTGIEHSKVVRYTRQT